MSKSVVPSVSVPAFVARAAAGMVGDPSEPDRLAAFGGDPVRVGCAAAEAALARGIEAFVADRGRALPADYRVARAAADAAAVPGLPAAPDGSFVGLVQSWRSPAEYLDGLVGSLPSCNGSLALLESRAAAIHAVLVAFDQFGLVSSADVALVRAQVAAVSAAVAADVAARAGYRF